MIEFDEKVDFIFTILPLFRCLEKAFFFISAAPKYFSSSLSPTPFSKVHPSRHHGPQDV
jgi:hypothetical protein